MSADFTFDISSSSDRLMTISLGGHLTVDKIEGVEPDVRKVIDENDGRRGVLWDLRKVRRVDLGARRAMQRLQSQFAAKEIRSAYVASRPRIRGVALWIVHTSGDALSRPFANPNEALDWIIESQQGRLEQIHERAHEIVNLGGNGGRR